MKAHECLQKLQGAQGLEVDNEVNTRFSGSTSVETEENACSARPKSDFAPTEKLRVQRQHRWVLKFTADEDERHAFGQWTAY